MLRAAILALCTGMALTMLVGRGIDLLNQPSTLAVTVGIALILTAVVVAFVVGEYAVNKLTKGNHDNNKTNTNGGASID